MPLIFEWLADPFRIALAAFAAAAAVLALLLLAALAGVHHAAELDVVQLAVPRLVELRDRRLDLRMCIGSFVSSEQICSTHGHGHGGDELVPHLFLVEGLARPPEIRSRDVPVAVRVHGLESFLYLGLLFDRVVAILTKLVFAVTSIMGFQSYVEIISLSEQGHKRLISLAQGAAAVHNVCTGIACIPPPPGPASGSSASFTQFRVLHPPSQ